MYTDVCSTPMPLKGLLDTITIPASAVDIDPTAFQDSYCCDHGYDKCNFKAGDQIIACEPLK